jgi:hypothetical protein
MATWTILPNNEECEITPADGTCTRWDSDRLANVEQKIL